VAIASIKRVFTSSFLSTTSPISGFSAKKGINQLENSLKKGNIFSIENDPINTSAPSICSSENSSILFIKPGASSNIFSHSGFLSSPKLSSIKLSRLILSFKFGLILIISGMISSLIFCWIFSVSLLRINCTITLSRFCLNAWFSFKISKWALIAG